MDARKPSTLDRSIDGVNYRDLIEFPGDPAEAALAIMSYTDRKHILDA